MVFFGAGVFDLEAHAIVRGGAYDTRGEGQRVSNGFELQENLNHGTEGEGATVLEAGSVLGMRAGANMAPNFFGVFVTWAWWVSLWC